MKQIKIALIEFDYHAEVLRNTLRILQQPNTTVQVFTTEKIWNQVNWKENKYFDLYLQKEAESLSQFLNAHISNINSCDIALFNTVASNFKTWSQLNIQAVKLIRIHNANAYFNSLTKAYKPKFTPFYIWKDSSHFVRKTVGELDWFYRKKFITGIDHFIFPSESIRKYALENYGLQEHNSWTLPFGYWENEKNYTINESRHFKICIIGRVDQRNRDYDTIVNTIKEFLPALVVNQMRLELVLLGSATSNYGKRISKELDTLSSEHFKPVYFQGFVPQEDFDRHINECDFFVIPTKIKTRYTIYEERYGYTKISGSINDVIKYHKPALIHKDYPIDDDLQPLFLSYSDSQDLARKILEWIKSRSYQNILFPQVLENHQLKAVQRKYRSVFEHILQNKN